MQKQAIYCRKTHCLLFCEIWSILVKDNLMTQSWSIVLQSDFIMPIYTSLQYFYFILPVFQKIFFMNTIIDLNSPCVISWMEKPKDFAVGLELHHYVTCKAPQHLRITLVICHAQLFFSEDKSIDSFVPMTYFFLSISRNNWNWLGVPDFQTLSVIKTCKGRLVVKPLIIPYYYALHIFSLFELDQHKDWIEMLF